MNIRLLFPAVLGIAFLWFAAPATVAQIPRTISYQGVLADGSGNLVPDGNHSLTINLYETASGGASIYSETQTVPVVKGVFNFIIGSGSGIPGSLLFDRAYFLGVSVDGGTELVPRTPMTAAPYALRAAVAESLAPGATGVVTSVNGEGGALTFQGSGGTTVSNVGNLFTINSSGGGGGLTLPYSNTMSSASDLFSLTNSGTARAGYFRNSNAASNVSALYGESNHDSPSTTVAGVEGKSTNGFGVIGRGGGNSAAMLGLVITTPTGGAFYAGTGVQGFSDTGHGVAGITYHSSSSGVYGVANNSGIGVQGTSDMGNAGFFNITTAANTSNALEGLTNGTGAGIYGYNSTGSGAMTGILGEAASTSNGGPLVGTSGVLGRITPTSPGAYSAGVRGINNGTGGNGVGVVGHQAGSGWGVYGYTPSGIGVYGATTEPASTGTGVRGETYSTSGIGVTAKYTGSGVGTPLFLDNGAIKVGGPNKAAFIHTATPNNKISNNGTDIDNPLCNGDPNCFLFVTQKLNPNGTVYNNSPIGVYYNTIRSKWEIFNENSAAIPNNAQFNVWVVKQ